eukprot:3716997-Pyramimonas_sp.AAC.1
MGSRARHGHSLSPYQAISPLENSILPQCIAHTSACPCRALIGARLKPPVNSPLWSVNSPLWS